jgi:hypothetical protein
MKYRQETVAERDRNGEFGTYGGQRIYPPLPAARTVRPGREVDSNHRSRPQPRGLSKPLRIALWTFEPAAATGLLRVQRRTKAGPSNIVRCQAVFRCRRCAAASRHSFFQQCNKAGCRPEKSRD